MGAQSAASRFIMPLGDASMMIDTIISELECDPVCERILQYNTNTHKQSFQPISIIFILDSPIMSSGLSLLSTVPSVQLAVLSPSPPPCLKSPTLKLLPTS